MSHRVQHNVTASTLYAQAEAYAGLKIWKTVPSTSTLPASSRLVCLVKKGEHQNENFEWPSNTRKEAGPQARGSSFIRQSNLQPVYTFTMELLFFW